MVGIPRRIRAREVQSHKTTAAEGKAKSPKKQSSQGNPKSLSQLALGYKVQGRNYRNSAKAQSQISHRGWTYPGLNWSLSLKRQYVLSI